MGVYLDIIIFAIIAVFLFLRLRGALGEVDENDPALKPPQEKKSQEKIAQKQHNTKDTSSEVKTTSSLWPNDVPDFKLVQSATVHNRLLRITEADNSFNPYVFLSGAVQVYEMIFQAVADKDKATVENLTKGQAQKALLAALSQDRQIDLPQIDTCVIHKAKLEGEIIQITVRYEAYAQDGVPFEDIWVFERPIETQEEFWHLIEIDEIDV